MLPSCAVIQARRQLPSAGSTHTHTQITHTHTHTHTQITHTHTHTGFNNTNISYLPPIPLSPRIYNKIALALAMPVKSSILPLFGNDRSMACDPCTKNTVHMCIDNFFLVLAVQTAWLYKTLEMLIQDYWFFDLFTLVFYQLIHVLCIKAPANLHISKSLHARYSMFVELHHSRHTHKHTHTHYTAVSILYSGHKNTCGRS